MMRLLPVAQIVTLNIELYFLYMPYLTTRPDSIGPIGTAYEVTDREAMIFPGRVILSSSNYGKVAPPFTTHEPKQLSHTAKRSVMIGPRGCSSVCMRRHRVLLEK